MALTHDTIVIGGGVTGLTVAHRLKKQGLAPLVIDSASPGGLIRSRAIEGFTLELGANTLVLSKEMEELLGDLRLLNAARFPVIEKYRQYVGFKDSIYEVPKSPPRFLASPLFSTAEKLRVLTGLGRKLRPNEIVEHETVAAFFTRILGAAPAHKIIAPVLRGIFGGDVDSLRASGVFPKLFRHLAEGGTLFSYGQAQKVLRRKIFCLVGGNETVCHALRADLHDVIEMAGVADLRYQNGIFTVQTENGAFFTSSTVVVATAGAASAHFLRTLSPKTAELGLKLRYAPIVAAHLSVPRESALLHEGFGVLFPKIANSALLGVMFNSLIFPHVAPPERHLVTVCLGGVGNEAVLDRTDSELFALAEEELRTKLGVTDPRPLSLIRWPRGIPQYDERQAELTAHYSELSSRYPGLFF
ncbi:MAG: hypothetical protein RL417_692, partial [Pseudomonadota bacterium]